MKPCQVPVVYAYATTLRRAQGSTLELTGLFFDRRRADRGYAYVGVSRVKRQADAYHIGPMWACPASSGRQTPTTLGPSAAATGDP